jgi:RNA polymerase sigma factor (TIGR02999 family)
MSTRRRRPPAFAFGARVSAARRLLFYRRSSAGEFDIRPTLDVVSEQPISDALVADVYAELRRLADRYVRRERAKSVQATELVHEAYLRLAQDKSAAFADRGHFVAIAAIAMRRLLIERARRRGAAKRGGGQVMVTLDESLMAGEDTTAALDLVSLDRALTRLADLDPRQARVVELRFFGGLSVEETAAALAISPATVKRDWTVARAWLLREIEGDARV